MDPRIQTLAWPVEDAIRLTAFPDASLTVILLPGERIDRVELSDANAFSVSVGESADALTVTPLRPGASAIMALETDRDSYSISLETGRGLMAAYVVRFVERDATGAPGQRTYEPGPMIGRYRLSGDRALRPIRIGDDGEKTFIEWGEYQAMPAVFGIGPTGDEEVVPGYMRDGLFTIDRVYPELVFRIDGEKARAERQGELGAR